MNDLNLYAKNDDDLKGLFVVANSTVKRFIDNIGI